MTSANDVRWAHEVLNGLSAGRILSRENEQLLRSFLPELPKQMTLAGIIAHVDDAWSVASGNDWGGNSYSPNISIEDWLTELHEQLKGLKNAPATDGGTFRLSPPEFLETEADYTDVPEGTILTMDGLDTAWVKKFDGWVSTETSRERSNKELGYIRRRVLRWGVGK